MNFTKKITLLFFILILLKSYAQLQKPLLSGYYVADSIHHNLNESDHLNWSKHTYSYLNMEDKVLTTYLFPKNQIDSLDIEKREFSKAFFANKPTLIWKDENCFAISIKDTILDNVIKIYSEFIRVEEDDERIVQAKKYIEQKQQKTDAAHLALKQEFLKSLNTPNGYLEYIPNTAFGLAKPLSVHSRSNIFIDRNFDYQLDDLINNYLLDKDNLLFYGIYKEETNTNNYNGLNLAIIKSEQPFTLHNFVKKLSLEQEIIVFKTEETLLFKSNFDEYIFFSVKKLERNSYAIAKGIANSFEYSKKQFQLFSTIDKTENVNALPVDVLFTELLLTKADSLFSEKVDKVLLNKTLPKNFIEKSLTGKSIYDVFNDQSAMHSYLEFKEMSIPDLIEIIKAENSAYYLIHQDKNSLVYEHKGSFNAFVLKPYKEYTVLLSLRQLGISAPIKKSIEKSVYFYKNAKAVVLNDYPIAENLKLYFNYFKSVWPVFNEKDNLFIVSNDKNIEGVFSVKGDYILPLKYNDISYSEESKGFYIETFDKKIIKAKPKDAIQNDRIVESDRMRGWASEDGKTVIEPQYHSIAKIRGADLAHVYSHNDEEGILNITTKKYIIPLKKHHIRHYQQERYFVISEDSGLQYLANYQGDVKGPFDRIKNNSGQFTGVKSGVETNIVFD
ncbi:hypothetical protein [Zunongwangia pacifica]|uniref:WG repeat protein n=1 Tax=Zunongwangia pacifica TaxID=2911062 RepID=A0A9X2A021_9FLAO|nr:hypothetical protein [Zunongwangia pacifica]MCL6220853.1 hypothetical protein [Zunongwangia pacifica]